MQSILSFTVSNIWAIATDVLLGLILTVILLRTVLKKSSLPDFKKGLAYCLVILFTSAVSYQIYAWWYYQSTPYGRNFLPPQSNYFYSQLGVALSNVISGVIATAIILTLGLLLVRKQKMSQFGTDDWLLLSIGTLAVGWPAVLPFLAIVIVLSILGLIIQILLKKKTLSDRLIITPYIMPAAIITLATKAQVLALTHLDKIRF